MSVFSSLGCFFDFHQPLRRQVAWNGRSYVGECRSCGAPIERRGRRKWRRRSDTDIDHSEPQAG